MPQARNSVRFLLNDAEITRSSFPATETLLDYLRLERDLTGSKEGCAEGDCGACTVLIGRLSNGELTYRSVTSCITFTGSLDGAHIVTVEHLSRPGGILHPIQQSMVDHHGSQCGFCTPGIVMSLYGMWLGSPNPSVPEIETALQGNLCRCTGYAPIIRAALDISRLGALKDDPLVARRAETRQRLEALADGARVEVGEGSDRFFLPASIDDLAAIYAKNPEATLIGGATDVGLWVTKLARAIGPLIFTSHLPEFHAIEDSGDRLRLAGGTTYTDARDAIVARYPQLGAFWDRIGGTQIRNMGTVGGNIANGSPIGDTPPVLIALGAELVLRKGNARRKIPIADFFIAYGKQDRAPGELVEAVEIPPLADEDLFAAYKISKRRDEDISALCLGMRVRVIGGVVSEAVIAFGGMAATPKRGTSAEKALIGQPLSTSTIEAAMAALETDFAPISDMRASAEYRMLTAKNLLRRFYLESRGEPASLVAGAA